MSGPTNPRDRDPATVSAAPLGIALAILLLATAAISPARAQPASAQPDDGEPSGATVPHGDPATADEGIAAGDGTARSSGAGAAGTTDSDGETGAGAPAAASRRSGSTTRSPGDPRDDRPLARIRMRHDTVLRWAPRYVLTASESPDSVSTMYWRKVDELPIYERLQFDARDLADGAVDAHLAAWGVLDASFDDRGDLLAGDFAVAHAILKQGPFSLWGGRRFLTWGPPGGAHIDGGGAALRTDVGLTAELAVGRPVTARRGTTLGTTGNYEGVPTVAYGGRIGYSDNERLSAGVGYLERWAEGIVQDRTLSVDLAWRPTERLDLLGSVAADNDALAPKQAKAFLSYMLLDPLELELEYLHMDPQRLLPAWSILSVFATTIYDDLGAGVLWHPTHSLSLHGEFAARISRVPDEQEDREQELGHRMEATVTVRPDPRRLQLLFQASRRVEGETHLTLLRLAGDAVVFDPMRIGLEGVLALDEDSHLNRDAMLGRGVIELPVGTSWTFGTTVEVAQTPIASAEVRGLLRASWQPGRDEEAGR